VKALSVNATAASTNNEAQKTQSSMHNKFSSLKGKMFDRYLQDSWSIAKNVYQNQKSNNLNVVLGNVSGDSDSVISSLLYGYYLTYKNGFYEDQED
jgi:hypothetical protein